MLEEGMRTINDTVCIEADQLDTRLNPNPKFSVGLGTHPCNPTQPSSIREVAGQRGYAQQVQKSLFLPLNLRHAASSFHLFF